MNLPTGSLATGTVTVAGQAVSFRSLSRAEALQLTQYGEGHEGEAEDFMLGKALGISEEEAHQWRESVNVLDSQPLIDAIIKLSGLSTDPKA